MIGKEAVYFDPETVTLLRETLDGRLGLPFAGTAGHDAEDRAGRTHPQIRSARRTRSKALACCCAGPCRLSGLLGWRRKRKAQAAA